MSMMMRRGMMVHKAPGGLPAEYLAVQYIESTGTQWIDTGVVPNVNTWARLKFINLDQTGNVIFGFFDTEMTSWRLFSGNGNYLDLPSGDNTYRYYTSFETHIKKDKLIELEVGNKFKRIIRNDGYPTLINTEFISTPIEAFVTVSKSLTLNYYNDNKVSLNRWYYVKIYNGNTLIRDMIPCIRISDSKPGMYDLVGRQFYVNAGTGEFIVGNSSDFYLENKAITQTKEYLDLKLLDKDEAFTVLCDFEVTSGYSETFAAGLDAFSCGETNGNFSKAVRIGNFSSYAMAYLNGQGAFKSPTSVSDLRTVCAIRYDPSQSNNLYSQLAGKNPALKNVSLTLSDAYADVGGANGASKTAEQSNTSGIIHGLYVYKRALTDQQMADFVNNGTVP